MSRHTWLVAWSTWRTTCIATNPSTLRWPVPWRRSVPTWTELRPHGLAKFTPEGIEEIRSSKDPRQTVRLARAGILPFFWMACWAVYAWGKRYLGIPEAVAATLLFTLLPPVLAHAGLATTDMALTASLSIAVLAVLVWLESPGWTRTVLMGAACAFTALTKFSALGYLPAAVLFCIIAWTVHNRPGWRGLLGLVRERAWKFAAAVVMGAFVVWGRILVLIRHDSGDGLAGACSRVFRRHSRGFHTRQGGPSGLSVGIDQPDRLVVLLSGSAGGGRPPSHFFCWRWAVLPSAGEGGEIQPSSTPSPLPPEFCSLRWPVT